MLRRAVAVMDAAMRVGKCRTFGLKGACSGVVVLGLLRTG
jgi:hypothetical protein